MSDSSSNFDFPARLVPRSMGKFSKFSIRDALKTVFFPTRQFQTIKTHLPPGYHEPFDRMLHACFSILVDYVEKECAREAFLEQPEAHTNRKRWYWAFYVHDALTGIRYLKDIINTAREVDSTDPGLSSYILEEGERATKILTLYVWWLNRNMKIVELTQLEQTDLAAYADESRDLTTEEYSKLHDLVELMPFLQF